MYLDEQTLSFSSKTTGLLKKDICLSQQKHCLFMNLQLPAMLYTKSRNASHQKPQCFTVKTLRLLGIKHYGFLRKRLRLLRERYGLFSIGYSLVLKQAAKQTVYN